MAHALIVEMQNGNLDHEFTTAYERVEQLALDRMPRIRNHTLTFLRDYAGTNHMEFIAVCTEHFFERADEFRSKDRELYDAFMWLYRQEPHTPPSVLQITNLPKEVKSSRNYRFARWHWSLTLALVGIFIAPGILLWQSQNVALPVGTKWIVALSVMFISAAILYKPIVNSGALGQTQFWLCHVVGLWPLLLSGFYLVNNYIPVWQQGEVHQVKTIRWETPTKARVNFTDEAFKDDKSYRTVKGVTRENFREGDFVVVVTQYGPFGVPVYGKNIVVSTSTSEHE